MEFKNTDKFVRIVSVLGFAIPTFDLFLRDNEFVFQFGFISLVEAALSFGFMSLKDRRVWSEKQTRLAEYFLRVAGLILTVLCLATGQEFSAAVRLSAGAAIVSNSGPKKTLYYLLLFGGGVIFLSTFRHFPLPEIGEIIGSVRVVMPATAIAVLALFWLLALRREKKSLMLARLHRSDALTVRKRETEFAKKILGESGVTLTSYVPMKTRSGILGSISFNLPEPWDSSFEREWDQFAGRVLSLLEKGGNFCFWEGQKLRVFKESGLTPSESIQAEVFDLFMDVIRFCKKTTTYLESRGFSWTGAVVCISVGSITNIPAGAGMPGQIQISSGYTAHDRVSIQTRSNFAFYLSSEFLSLLSSRVPAQAIRAAGEGWFQAPDP